MARLHPLQDAENELVEEGWRLAEERLGFIPNSLRILARKPEILVAYSRLAHAILTGDRVSGELKGLISHISSRAAGCQYCSAHTAGIALSRDVPADKVESIWEFETSSLFSDAERVALRIALLSSQIPNGATDEDFDALKEHFEEDEIVEIIAVVALFGFLNRWNDSLATPLEPNPREVGEQHLQGWGWSAGKHTSD